MTIHGNIISVLNKQHFIGSLDNLNCHYLSFKNSANGCIILGSDFDTATTGRNIWKLWMLMCSEALDHHSLFHRPRQFSFITAKTGSKGLVLSSKCKPPGGGWFFSHLF